MARRTEDVKRDIEQARDELGSTLEAIGDRVAPKKVVKRVKTNVSDKVEDVKDRVSPIRLARRGTDNVRQSLQGARGHLGSGGNGNGHERGGSDELPPSRARIGSNRVRTQELASRAGDAAGTMVEQARSAPTSVKERAQENPLVAGLIAFGGGFLLASVLPPSERERQVTGRARERLEPARQKALETGRGVTDELKGVALEGLDGLKERATLAAIQVKDEALLLAERVKEDARSSAGQVKEEATGAGKVVHTKARTATQRVKAKAEDAAITTTGKARTRRAPATTTGRPRTGTATRRAPAAASR